MERRASSPVLAAEDIPKVTSPEDIGLGAADRIFSGDAINFSRQPPQQK
jgi:hypothetical protein